MDQSESSKLLTVEEAAERLRVAPDTVYDLCREPDFPAARVGKQIRVPEEQLREWIRTGGSSE